MSNTICEVKIEIKDELPELEELETIQIPPKPNHYPCNKCEKVYKENYLLNQHLKTHERDYCCKICGKDCKNSSHLYSHSLIHRKSSIKVLSNEIISFKKEEPSKPSITLKVPAKKDKFPCNKCDKSYKEFQFLKRHLETHDKEYKCKICGEKFGDCNKLSLHTRGHKIKAAILENPETKIVGKLPYSCTKCDQTFTWYQELNKHLKSHEKKDYICEICGKTFKNSYNLKQHVFAHKDTKGFQCDLCEKSFKTRSNLVQHKYGHAEERAYKCSVCEKAFKYKEVLKRHELGHKNEQRFLCSGCGERFKYKVLLRAHQTYKCTNNKEID
jgi:uncharacterized Zn-finger protein